MEAKTFRSIQKKRRKKVISYKKVGRYSKKRKFGGRNNKKKDSKLRRVVKRVLLTIFIGGFLLTIGGVVFGLTKIGEYTKRVPTEESIRAMYSEQWTNSKIYDRNGKLLYEVSDPNKTREYVYIDDVPPEVKWMVIAAEDHEFYDNKGIDYLATAKAGVCYITREYITKKKGTTCAGGSTLTQQLMKNWFFDSNKQIERKIMEAIVTLRTQQILSKDEVLEAYLNTAQYGSTVFGIKTASKVYFDKELDELTLAEIATLAAVPNQPGILAVPFSSDPEKATELVDQRRSYVLDQFERVVDKVNAKIEDDESKITPELIAEAREETIVYKRGQVEKMKAPHFVTYVQKVLTEPPFEFNSNDISGGGYSIYTSLDMDIQEIAEEEVKKHVDTRLKPQYGQYNAALSLINPKTGEILAYVGSKDFYGEQEQCSVQNGVEACKFDPQVDILQSRNAAGSSLKPMVTLTGIEQGTLYSSSFVPDVPMQFGNYKPTNYDGGYMGPMKIRRALLYSRNIPYVQAIQVVGVSNFLDKMEQLGYSIDGERSNYGPAVALGAIDIKLLDHTFAYGVLVNGGIKMPRTSVLKIVDKNGEVVYEYQKGEGERVADEGAAYIVSDMLGDRNYLNYGYIQKFINEGYWGGKSGTSDFYKDTYFMGGSPEIVAGVWSGNNDNSSGGKNVSGSGTALPLWNSFLKRIADKYPHTQLHRPSSVVSKSVCSDSGLLASDKTACKTEVELFLADKLPPKDDTHQNILVCKDQQDHIAREIDIKTGNAVEKNFVYLKTLNEDWQPFLDKYLKISGNPTPTEECTIDRSPNNNDKPWVTFVSPTDGTKIKTDTLSYEVLGYSKANVVKIELLFDGKIIKSSENDSLKGSYKVPSSYVDGSYSLSARIYDSANRSDTYSIVVTLERGIGAQEDTGVDMVKPTEGQIINTPFNIEAEITGDTSKVSEAVFYGKNNTTDDTVQLGKVSSVNLDGTVNYLWQDESAAGSYTLYVELTLNDNSTVQSNLVSVFVI